MGGLCTAEVLLEDLPCQALLDTGSQLCFITAPLAQRLALPIYNISTLASNPLRLEGTGGMTVPYMGYVTCRVRVAAVAGYDAEHIFFVIPESATTKDMPVQLGTNFLSPAVARLTESEMDGLSESWLTARAVMMMADPKKATANTLPVHAKKALPTRGPAPVKIFAAKRAVVPPFQTIGIPIRSQGPNIGGAKMVEDPREIEPDTVITVPTYLAVKDRRQVALRNPTCEPIEVDEHTPLGTIRDAAVEVSGSEMEDLGKKPVSSPMTTDERKAAVAEKIDLSGLDEHPAYQARAMALLQEMHDVFSLHDLDLGRTDRVKHTIRLHDKTPFRERYRRIAPTELEEVKKKVDEMLRVGAVGESCSPWCSAVVLARRKDGTLRFCIDLRRLNEQTIKDAQTIPRIDEALDNLKGAKWFTALDLKSGYWQVPLDEESQPLTAFSLGPLGFYECKRMPFGLTNAPATFQRLMENVLREANLKMALIYLDDVFVHARTLDEALARLRVVLGKLRDAGLKLNPKKCDFFRKSIHYLGHIISERGIETDAEKVAAVVNWPTPHNVKGVRQFLGFSGYYRRYMKGYAKVANPLTSLLLGISPKTKKTAPIEWTEECQASFDAIKRLLSSSPVLGFADYSAPFILNTDASLEGLGAALYQKGEDGRDHPIAFASRVLKASEKNYPSHKLEFLALKWAITGPFKDYLYASAHPFTCFTDNNPLTYVFTAELDTTMHRWIAALAPYNFSITYKKGTANVDADALSRRPPTVEELRALPDADLTRLEPQTVNALLQGVTQQGPLNDTFAKTEAVVATCFAALPAPAATAMDWTAEQSSDDALAVVLRLLEKGELGRYRPQQTDSDEFRAWVSKRGKLSLQAGAVVYTSFNDHRQAPDVRLAVPAKLRGRVIHSCHDDMGHQGRDRTLSLLRSRFYWPNMQRDVEAYLAHCQNCLYAKAPVLRAPLHSFTARLTMELVHLDFTSINEGPRGGPRKKNSILVATDNRSKMAMAVPVPAETARAVAHALIYQIAAHWGYPARILSDRGSAFDSQVVAELCDSLGIARSRTTPYHPQSNGQCERFNSTLIHMIATLDDDKRSNWKKYLPLLVSAYNQTPHSTLGISPFEMFTGQRPRIPADVEFNTPYHRARSRAPARYVEDLRRRLHWAAAQAEAATARSKERGRRSHPSRGATTLRPGDLVLVRNFSKNSKIDHVWAPTVHEVVQVAPDHIPTYDVRPVDSDSAGTSSYHREHLRLLAETVDPDDFAHKPTDSTHSKERVPTVGPVTRSRAAALAGSLAARVAGWWPFE